jgi:HAD superfamily hydrolase (TIGR01509 family)
MATEIEALTFDWYGTLAYHRYNKGRRSLFSEYLYSYGLDAARWDRQVLYEIFEYYGEAYKPELSDDQKRTFWIRFTKLLFKRSHVSGAAASRSELHSAAIREIFGSGCFQLYSDVQPVLHSLRLCKLRLAVVSNWHRGLDSFCREMNLTGLLDGVISSSDIGIEKPAPGIFKEAARRLRVKPNRIVHIGDSPEEDFDGAVAAGLRAVLIDRNNTHGTHLNRINSLYELEALLPEYTVP